MGFIVMIYVMQAAAEPPVRCMDSLQLRIIFCEHGEV